MNNPHSPTYAHVADNETKIAALYSANKKPSFEDLVNKRLAENEAKSHNAKGSK